MEETLATMVEAGKPEEVLGMVARVEGRTAAGSTAMGAVERDMRVAVDRAGAGLWGVEARAKATLADVDSVVEVREAGGEVEVAMEKGRLGEEALVGEV